MARHSKSRDVQDLVLLCYLYQAHKCLQLHHTLDLSRFLSHPACSHCQSACQSHTSQVLTDVTLESSVISLTAVSH